MKEYIYGGFWRRAVAFSIDHALLFIFFTILLFMLRRIVPFVDISSQSSEWKITVLIPYYGTTLILNMIYFTFFHGVGGRTPGKMLLGLKVIQHSGKPVSPGLAFLRWVGYQISHIVFLLGFIWVAFDSKKQGWHDKIAGTCVISPRGRAVERLQRRAEFTHAGYPAVREGEEVPEKKWYPY